MNIDNYPKNGGPQAVKVGLSKHAMIDIFLGVLSIAMALPGVYLLVERGEWKAGAVANAAALVSMTNDIRRLNEDREKLATAWLENVRHSYQMSSAVQQFLTNQNISELEIAPTRVSIFRTNRNFGPTWTFRVTPTNVIAQKALLSTNGPITVIGNGNRVAAGDIVITQ